MVRNLRVLSGENRKTGGEAARAANRAQERCLLFAVHFWRALPLLLLCQCGEPMDDQGAAARTLVAQREAQGKREVQELIAALLPFPPEGEVPQATPLVIPEKTDDPERDLSQFETALKRADAQILGLFIAIYQQSARLQRIDPENVRQQLDRALPELRARFEALRTHREALLAEIAALQLQAHPPTGR